jgi:hypothetical protein
MADIETPPPHLLKKFSTEARDESNKRNGAGYLKTFAKLCIEWANSQSTPNDRQIRSSEITPPQALVREWCEQLFGCPDEPEINAFELARWAGQWGADQELSACCVLMDDWGLDGNDLMECRRPKPLSLKQQALAQLDLLSQKAYARDFAGFQADTIRAALETLDD